MDVVPRLLALATLILPAGPAIAQTLPWPGDAPGAGAPAPWPGQGGAPPTGMSSTIGGGGAPPPRCMAEFTRLRGEVEKKGMAAKAAGQRHASREELCALVTSYADAEATWVRFTEAGVRTCGIAVQVANQLKQMLANTEQTREKICTGHTGPAASVMQPSRVNVFRGSGNLSIRNNDAWLWRRYIRNNDAWLWLPRR